MNPTVTSMPTNAMPDADPLEFYEHALAVVEFQIQELLINRLYTPNPDNPATPKDLDLATRLLKSGLEIRRKIKNLRAPNKPIEPKRAEPKTNSSKSAPLTESTSQSEPAPKPDSTPKLDPASDSVSASEPTSVPIAPCAPSTPSLSSLSSLPAAQSNSSAPSSASKLRFRLTESATQRYLRERQNELAANSRSSP